MSTKQKWFKGSKSKKAFTGSYLTRKTKGGKASRFFALDADDGKGRSIEFPSPQAAIKAGWIRR